MKSLAGRLAVLLVCALAACKRSPMGKVEDMRDALASDAVRWDSALPACNVRATCARDIATAIGAPFDDKRPDQVSAAAVAVVVARDHHGSDVPEPHIWLASIGKAKGSGADALRLAVALEMSSVAGKHSHAIDTDEDARAFLADVAAAIPGACNTYAALGEGKPEGSLLLDETPDHSPCVQHDLSRKDGPGPTYGEGLFRAVAGALALWKAELAALHEGSALMDGRPKAALEARLVILDAATPKILPKTVSAPAGNVWSQTRTQHDTSLAPDAGR